MKKAKATGVAKPAKAAKPPGPAVQKLQHQVASLQRQVTSLKHPGHAKAKHSQATKKTAKHSTTRKWSPDEDVALCSARAVAKALELAGAPVLSDADVLALYRATASDPDEGQTLTDALSAARDRGLLGPAEPLDVAWPGLIAAGTGPSSLIVGLDLPWGEPHAVTVDIDGTWWSWGEPHTPDDFPGAVIEEAWVVTA